MIIDAHSHIDYISCHLQPDVVGTICCTTNESQWEKLIDITNTDNRVYGAFGVHPWYLDSVQDDFDKRLEELLKNDPNYMIGEIGLDKYKPCMEKQIDIFKKQLSIAVLLKRYVFLHCVGAWDKILNILKDYRKTDLPLMVVHDFHGSKEILLYLLNNYNVMFSFNKTAFVQNVPTDKILVETDGKTDVVLSDLIAKIAEIKQDVNISDIIYNNTLRILKHD